MKYTADHQFHMYMCCRMQGDRDRKGPGARDVVMHSEQDVMLRK